MYYRCLKDPVLITTTTLLSLWEMKNVVPFGLSLDTIKWTKMAQKLFENRQMSNALKSHRPPPRLELATTSSSLLLACIFKSNLEISMECWNNKLSQNTQNGLNTRVIVYSLGIMLFYIFWHLWRTCFCLKTSMMSRRSSSR